MPRLGRGSSVGDQRAPQVLAATEPPEATLLWDTRCATPAATLRPDGGDRARLRPGDAPVLGNAMAMRL